MIQEFEQITKAERQANALCDQAQKQAAARLVQEDADGKAHLQMRMAEEQTRLREAEEQAERQAAQFAQELRGKTAEQCKKLEQTARQRLDAATAMIVERIWNGEWRS